VDVAFFVSDVAPRTGDAFVEFGVSLEAGHATQSRCSLDTIDGEY
jgi:hypothetical protein